MDLELGNITFRGPDFEVNSPVVDLLPANLVDLLTRINGFVQFGGGLHVRGVCAEPTWHSIAEVMVGPRALERQYEWVLPTNVPFAQDCMADQFLLRDGQVCKLQSETGKVHSLDLRLPQFFAAVEADPVGFLAMHPLLRFRHSARAGPSASGVPAVLHEGGCQRRLASCDQRDRGIGLSRRVLPPSVWPP
jgi:hypothetical protein